MAKDTTKRMQQISRKIHFPTDTPNENGRVYTEESVQQMVKNFRKLNEQEEETRSRSRKTAYDQKEEEDKFRKNFEDLNVVVDFKPLEVTDNYVLWGGTIDGMIEFVYKVTRDESTSGVDYIYSDELSGDNPENQEIVDRIEQYYDTFFKYWKKEIFD